ncbi:C39 family peptidase [Dactylosporangium sp. CS-033363]|uniref:C39 family peptidase n=1 Tax=Dactylosporangium sp. CS-033363 TaxID=3239935 RepID=UPI003D9301B3
MSYLYRSRHAKQRTPRRRRLPIVATAAVLTVTAGLGAAHMGNAAEPAPSPPVAAESPAPRETQAAASRAKRPEPSATPSQAPADKELQYQFAWQENYYYCGPAATRIALTARGLFPSQDQVAQNLGTTESGTNSSDDTTRTLNALTGSGFYTAHFIRGQSATADDVEQLRQSVVKAVSQGYAVVANIAGSTVDDGGHAHAYPGGHYLTIVGYYNNGATVKIADPADATGVGSYHLSVQSMANWIALRGYAA